MNRSSVFSALKSTFFFSDSVLCLGKIHENPNQTLHGNKDWSGSKTSQECGDFDRIDGEPMELEWNIFPGFNTLQLSQELKELLVRLNETPENLQEGSSSCGCSTTSHGDEKTTR